MSLRHRLGSGARVWLPLTLILAGAACGDGTGPDPRRPASLAKVSGDAQSAAIGSALPLALRVRVTNSEGSGIEAITVEFARTSGAATVSPGIDTTDAGGFAETFVTLGTAGGDIQVRASIPGSPLAPVTFTATALAPTTIEIFSGDGQSGAVGAAFPQPLRARVRDQQSNPFAGAQVQWTISAEPDSGAALDSTVTTTDAQGIASTTGRFGFTQGPHTITATIVGVSATPASFSLSAILAPVINLITPDPIQEANAATLTGSNFSSTLGENSVTVDGAAAAVLTATSTTLDITVPRTRCLPARDAAAVQASVSGLAGSIFFHPAVPGDPPLTLAVGANETRADSAGVECIQLAAETNPSSHLVISAVTRTGSDLFAPERLTQTRGSSTTFGVGGFDATPFTASASATGAALSTEAASLEGAREFESRIRQYERAWLSGKTGAARSGPPAPGARSFGLSGSAVPVEGDTFRLNVPIGPTNFCTQFATVKVQVKAVGTFGIAVEDTAAPTGGFSDLDYQQIVNEFDSTIYPTDTLYFGSPSDIDGNQQHVLLLYTPEVNKLTPSGANFVVLGFFFTGDLFPTSVCLGSNQAELFYLLVPDPDPATAINGNQRSTSFVQQNTRGTVAHEFQHLINAAQKIASGASTFEEVWLNEGLSHVAEEVVGHAVTGSTPGSDLTCAQFMNCGSNDFDAFYRNNLSRARFYLDSDSIARNSPIAPDDNLATRGATWLLLRWILDQEAASPLTENQITRAMVVNQTLTGIANLENAVGKTFADLASEWLPALYTDNLGVSGLSTRLTIPSWDLRDIYNGLSGSYPLVPTGLTFTDGATDFEVRSGSGRFFLLQSGLPSPALSLRLTDQADGALDLGLLDPRTLIVRIQ